MNKKIYIENIYFLAKKCGKKISEIEKASGVSVGYFSRLLKDNNTAPSIEILYTVAKLLGITIDSLVSIDYSSITPTEESIVNLIDTLIDRTLHDKTIWEKELLILHQIAVLNPSGDFAGKGNHPLYTFKTYSDPYSEKPDSYETHYNSLFHFSALNEVKVSNDVYYAEIGRSVYFYIVPVEFIDNDDEKKAKQDIEFYLVSAGKPEPICNTFDKSLTIFNEKLENLYLCAKENSGHTKISNNVKTVIDKYINEKEIDAACLPDFDDLPFF